MNQSAVAPVEVSVFDQALSRRASNDNNYLRLVCDDPEDAPRRQKQKPFRLDEIPVEIPADKASARALLDRLGVGASVSMSVACANANLPVDGGWRGEVKEPSGPKEWKPRKRNPANSNEPENWPILETLRRDGRGDDVALVLRYWSLVEKTGAEMVGSNFRFDGVQAGSAGSSVYETGLSVASRSLTLHGVREVNRAHQAGWPTEQVPGGDISYRESRQSVQQLVIGTGHRTVAAGEDSVDRSQASLHHGNPEDAIIESMDGKPVLAALRADLGGLGFVLEDAVCARSTLTWIGTHLGYKNKARSAKAKVLVYTAIDRLRDRWRLVDRDLVVSAAACERRLEERRAELEAERVRYLGLVAAMNAAA